jgi:hypothetical protein
VRHHDDGKAPRPSFCLSCSHDQHPNSGSTINTADRAATPPFARRLLAVPSSSSRTVSTEDRPAATIPPSFTEYSLTSFPAARLRAGRLRDLTRKVSAPRIRALELVPTEALR